MIATLSLALYTSLTIAFKAKKSAEAAVAPARTAAIIADLIGRDLENVQPLSRSEDYPQPFYGMPAGVSGGVSDTLEFYAIGSEGELHGPGGAGDELPFAQGMRKVYLGVRSDGETPLLVRGIERNLFPTTDSPIEEEILCTGVRAFTIRYYDGYDWLEEWDSDSPDTPGLPQAVEINIEVQSPDGTISRVTRIIPIASAESPAI